MRRWLAKRPRFHLHFTSTSASWLNRRGVHRTIVELETAIRHFIDNHDHNPKPFIWTKTADQVLDSVARFCK